jgi:thioesterase domain-containing protein
MRPVPVRVPGEIYIGGLGVARGYRGNPALTADKFISDPYGLRSGLRLYRSGDLGRFLSDGNIDLAGRNDNQLKVRGYRIEPGEIESALAEHPLVLQSIVRAAADRTGNNVLAAYLVLREKQPEESAVVSEIARWLSTRLPEYMVPQFFVPLDAIPLLPNGKTDFNSLPPPETEARLRPVAYAAPRDPLESQLVDIWEEVLGRSSIGINENFFSLGGHSLLAARLFGQIERRMGKILPLATLFQAPTVDQFAAVLRREGWQVPWSSLVPIKPAGKKPPFYCVHALGGNVIGYTELAMSLPDDQPVYGLQAMGLDGRQHPASTVEEMAAQYVKEIRALQPSGPYYLGGACTGGIVAYEVAQRLVEQGEEIGLLAMFDTFVHTHIRSLSKKERREFRRKTQRDRLKYHATNLMLRPGRIEYVRKKLKTMRKRLSTRVWGILYRRYTRLKLPLPASLQKVEQFHILAIGKYVPRPYPGRVTLFPPISRSIGEFDDREQGWGALAQGGVEIHDVEGDHLTMLAEPLVKAVAAQLSECLRRGYERHALPKESHGL